jgi:predicted nucleotidyltransferase
MVEVDNIVELAERIVQQFHPERIILLGSYAYGRPTADSDVDLLVVLPFEGHPAHKAAEIRTSIRAPFPMDLLARTPQQVQRRVEQGDFFMREIMEKGKVLYEASDQRVGRQGGG